MGHGLQTWLQTVWFLTRTSKDATIVLDEPDVYLHADLQRKLIRLLRGAYRQVIVATHSLEIVSDVAPSSILIVDKGKNNSKFADNIDAVQSIIDNIGGVQNIQLTRFWAARKCLMVEGDDHGIIKEIYSLVLPDQSDDFDSIPVISLGGKGNWRHAVGAAIGLRNAGGEEIKTYCILDRDYMLDEESKELYESCKKSGLILHVWKRKEIENYLVTHSGVFRYIEGKLQKNIKKLSSGIVKEKIEEICESQKNETTDNIADVVLARYRARGIKNANERARKIVETAWETYEGKISIVSGKNIFSALSIWAQQQYGVSFSPLTIARELMKDELPVELEEVVRKIEKGIAF